MLRKSFLTGLFVLALSISSTARAQSNDAVKAALDRTLPEIKFTNVALRDCFDFLRDVTGANIHVNWRAIEAAGVTQETQVNVRLRTITLRKVLNLLLSEAGAAAGLAFYTDQGVIEITTREIADKQMITKVYNVEDLLVEIVDFEPSTSFGLGSNSSTNNGTSARSGSGTGTYGGTGRTGGGGGGIQPIGGGAGGGGLSGSGGDTGKSKTARGDDLVKLIVDTIQSDIWRQNGGPASIKFWNGNLIITAPRSIHEQIGGPVD